MMTTLSSSFFDLIDAYKLENPDGTAADIIEMLTQMNPILQDAVAMECNSGANHVHTVRTGLPSVAWGKLYQGISQSKGQTAQVTDTTGWVEALSTIDCRLLDKYMNPKTRGMVRLSEGRSFLEAMSQEVSSKIFYGNTGTNPDQILGLAPRFNSLSAAVPNSQNVINAGGVGSDNTSIYIVTWGDKQTSLLYPAGSKAGFERKDMGPQRVLDASGNPYYAEEEMFHWDVGLAVADWRYVVRICNIDVSNMLAGSVNLFTFLRRAMYRHQSQEMDVGKTAIYCNRDVMEALDALSTNAGSTDNFTRLNYGEVQGKKVTTYRGIPIRRCDAIINAEALVS